MANKVYEVRGDRTRRIELDYLFGFRNVRVAVDGVEAATLPDVVALKRGTSVELAGGGTQRVGWIKGGLGAGLALWLDEEPVPGTYADAWVSVRGLSTLYFCLVAGVTIGLTLSVMSGGPEDLIQEAPFVVWTVAIAQGLFYTLVGWFVRRGAFVAHVIGTAAYALGALLDSYFFVIDGTGLPGLLLVAYVLYLLIRGFGAFKLFKEQEAARRSREHAATFE